ncbi:6339_t:CDS:2, partial [Acaulospora colombiana]
EHSLQLVGKNMEVNKDEALRCLKIARDKLEAGEVSGAIKFARKSVSLFPTTEAEAFLKRAESTKTTSNRESSSHQSPPTSPSSPSREHKQGRQTREYTMEQVEAVKRIRSCGVNDYYSILSIRKESSDAEVKKAYRKLALQMHPDKNGAPGADEAFKTFQILSDPQKRAIYDEHGADPDSRSTGMPSGFGGARFNNGFANGAVFTEEMSPEDLFNMFFSGDESRHTRSLYVPYFVEPNQFASFAQNPRKLQQFEDGIEIKFVKSLTNECNNELVMKQRKVNEAKGWLFPDEEKLKSAQNTKLPSCEKLMELSKSQRYKEIRNMMVRQ